MSMCDCGGCKSCLRAQGAWGDRCEICNGWIDYDRDEVSKCGHYHLACEEAYEDQCTGEESPPEGCDPYVAGGNDVGAKLRNFVIAMATKAKR